MFIPGAFNADKRKLFFFWSQEYQRRNDPVAERLQPCADGARAPGRLLAERRQQRAIRFRTSAITRPGCPAARPTRAAASRTAACSGGSRPNRLYQPGVNALNIYPAAERRTAAAASTTASQAPTKNPRREDLIRLDLQATEQLARHRPLHEHEERPDAAVRHDVGRRTAATTSTRSTRCSTRPATTG